MKHEDKLGTLEEAIEFDKKRNYQYTELTDDEILFIYAECPSDICIGIDPLKFARAILKKASEK